MSLRESLLGQTYNTNLFSLLRSSALNEVASERMLEVGGWLEGVREFQIGANGSA